MSETPTENKRSIVESLMWFGAWCLLIVCGFAYVSVVLCNRDYPFHSGNGSSRDLLVILLLCPIFYWLGPRQNWPLVKKSPIAVLIRNVLVYVLLFFLTLHWEFVVPLLGVNFALKASSLSSLDLRSWVVVAIAFVAVLGLLVFHLLWAHREKILYRYLAALIGIPALVALISFYLGDRYYIHVHHYCVGVFLFPFFRFRQIASLAAQAFFLGMTVEGISRWGADSLWYVLR